MSRQNKSNFLVDESQFAIEFPFSDQKYLKMIETLFLFSGATSTSGATYLVTMASLCCVVVWLVAWVLGCDHSQTTPPPNPPNLEMR